MAEPGLVIAVKLGDRTVRIEDLPLLAVDKIAKACDVTWLNVVASPLSDLLVGGMVVEAVAEHLGCPAPEGLSVRQLTMLFTTVPDDVAEPEKTVQVDEFEDDPDPFGSNGNATSTVGSRS